MRATRMGALIKGARPTAADLILYILSVDGQRTLARHGFAAVGLPTPPPP